MKTVIYFLILAAIGWLLWKIGKGLAIVVIAILAVWYLHNQYQDYMLQNCLKSSPTANCDKYK